MELAPGVRVLRAADGFNNLSVPMGTDEWVEAELVRMVREQDKRLKLIVALARHVGSETMSCGRSVGLQSARLAAENRPFCATLFSPRALEGSGPLGRLDMGPGCARVPR